MLIDFQTLQDLSGGKAMADAPCPLCCASCKTPSNRNRKVLRIFNKDDGFATYTCARCGEKGFAHAGNRSASRKSADKVVADVIAAFQQKPLAAPTKPEPDNDKLRMLRSLWRRSVPAQGTVVETYLRSRRCWKSTETVRYLPPRGEHPPALIVPFGLPTEPEPGVLDIATADIHGIQLTKLKADGSGKADVEPKKMTLGQCVGWPIVLAAPNDLLGLTIAEGVEDALSNHLVSGRGAWAAGGANRMPALADRVPSYVESVTILVDDNDAGRRGSEDLARRLHARGVEVLMLPSGGGSNVA
jgi:Toprim domain